MDPLGIVASPYWLRLTEYRTSSLRINQTKIWSTPGQCFLSVLDIPLNGKQGKCVGTTQSSDHVSQLLNKLPPQEPGLIRVYIEELPDHQALLSHLQSILGHDKARDIYESMFTDHIHERDSISALTSQWNANPQWLKARNILPVSPTKSGGKLRHFFSSLSAQHPLPASVEMMTSLRCVPMKREREEGSRKETGKGNEKDIEEAGEEGEVVMEIEEEAKEGETEEKLEKEKATKREKQKEEEGPMIGT